MKDETRLTLYVILIMTHHFVLYRLVPFGIFLAVSAILYNYLMGAIA